MAGEEFATLEPREGGNQQKESESARVLFFSSFLFSNQLARFSTASVTCQSGGDPRSSFLCLVYCGGVSPTISMPCCWSCARSRAFSFFSSSIFITEQTNKKSQHLFFLHQQQFKSRTNFLVWTFLLTYALSKIWSRTIIHAALLNDGPAHNRLDYQILMYVISSLFPFGELGLHCQSKERLEEGCWALSIGTTIYCECLSSPGFKRELQRPHSSGISKACESALACTQFLHNPPLCAQLPKSLKALISSYTFH